MAVSDALFQALAEARSRPSQGFRTFQNAVGAVEAPVQGYMAGKQAQADLLEKKLKPYEIYSKIAEQAGPDAANNIFKQAGMPIPDMSAGTGPSSAPKTPEQLMQMGNYGKNQLGMRKTAEDISNNAPYSADEVRGMLSSNPQAADALIQAYPNGQIPSRVVQNAIAGLSANRLSGMISTKQFQLLPSQSGPNTAAGAAYQVKVAARQGKSLIAKASTPQALALASADLSRAVQRAAPVAETIGAGNFAQSLPTLWSQFQQKMTADPNGPDVPKMRKALYDQFDELDKAASPWIANHLQNMEDSGTSSSFGGNWGAVKNRELGNNIPEIPFQDTSTPNPNVATGVPVPWKTAKNSQGVTIRSKDNWATFEPVPPGGQ